MSWFSLCFSFTLFTSVSSVFLARNPVYGVLSFMAVVMHVVLILILLDLEFLAYVLAIIYIGAIVVLFLFVIMMFYIYNYKTKRSFFRMCSEYYILGFLASNLHYFVFIFVDFSWSNFAEIVFARNLLVVMAQLLFNEGLILTCVLALIMLVGVIGAVLLTVQINFSTKYLHNVKVRNLSTDNLSKNKL